MIADRARLEKISAIFDEKRVVLVRDHNIFACAIDGRSHEIVTAPVATPRQPLSPPIVLVAVHADTADDPCCVERHGKTAPNKPTLNTRSQISGNSGASAKACVYCGTDATTRDHTPPRCLLQRPLPSNLLTLPACSACNGDFSFDESVVLLVLTCASQHPDMVASRSPDGRMARAIEGSSKLRGVYERSIVPRANAITDEVLESFRRVFFKTVRGLFFGLYGGIVPEEELYLAVMDTCDSVSAEQIAERFRPSPFEDITDKPFGEISPSSWHMREPIFTMDLVSPSGKSKTVKRVFRLKRETPIEWIDVQPGIFRYAFVKNEGAKSACVMKLWEILVVAVTTPWPASRGPIRRGRKNPLSREK